MPSETLHQIDRSDSHRRPGYEVTAWFGIMLPKGAPKDIVLRINAEANKALVQADMKEKLLQQGAMATAWTPFPV
jgi:tripartite-type tricarboxylate transporter receptor subunit TctC